MFSLNISDFVNSSAIKGFLDVKMLVGSSGMGLKGDGYLTKGRKTGQFVD